MSRPEIRTRPVTFFVAICSGLRESITEVWLSGDIETGIDRPGITDLLEASTAVFYATLNHAIPCPTS
jgi:hypothetical protein